MAEKIRDEASATAAEAGVVLVDGPGGVTFSLTPGAAKETGERLKASAETAQGQLDGKVPLVDL